MFERHTLPSPARSGGRFRAVAGATALLLWACAAGASFAADARLLTPLAEELEMPADLRAANSSVLARLEPADFDALVADGGGMVRGLFLPDGRSVDIAVQLKDPAKSVVPAGMVVHVMGENGSDTVLPLPVPQTFYGEIVNEPGSFLHLIRVGGQVFGSLETNGTKLAIVPVEDEELRAQAGPNLYQISGAGDGQSFDEFECGAESLPRLKEFREPFPEEADFLFPTRAGSASGVARASLADRKMTIALEGTFEFYQRRSSNVDNATNYLVALMSEVSAIYERDVLARYEIANVRIWTTSADPYAANNANTSLDDLSDVMNDSGTPAEIRNANMAHMLTAGSGWGGLAYVDVLCASNPFRTGVSNLNAVYNYPTQSYTWDVNVLAHELGHNVASPHTHCYSPPIDMCYGLGGNGCYSGSSVPQQGTLMSYCHLVASVRLEFHDRVKMVMRSALLSAGCVEVVTPGGGGDERDEFSFTGPAIAIPDNNPTGAVSTILVSGLEGTIADLDVRFDGDSCTANQGATTVGLDHSFVGDLTITLESPAGAIVTLVDRPGDPATSGGIGGNNFCGTIMDDEGILAIEAASSGSAPFTGRWRPNTPLSDVDGQEANGVWTLRVVDNAATDTGNIRAWTLAFIMDPNGCAPRANNDQDFAATGSAGWNFVSQANLPPFFFGDIQNSAPGGALVVSNPAFRSFGYWKAPDTVQQSCPGVLVFHDFDVTSDQAAHDDALWIRFRGEDGLFHQALEHVVAPGSASPVVGAETRHTLVLSSDGDPAAPKAIQPTFDVSQFTRPDLATLNATYRLDRHQTRQYDAPALDALSTLIGTLDISSPDVIPGASIGWAGIDPARPNDFFQSANMLTTQGGQPAWVFEKTAGMASQNELIGLFQKAYSNLTVAADTMYIAEFTVNTDIADTANAPNYRVRANLVGQAGALGTHNEAWVANVNTTALLDNQGQPVTSYAKYPTPGSPEVVKLYIVPHPRSVGANFLFAFDLNDVSTPETVNSAAGRLWVSRIRLRSVPLDQIETARIR